MTPAELSRFYVASRNPAEDLAAFTADGADMNALWPTLPGAVYARILAMLVQRRGLGALRAKQIVRDVHVKWVDTATAWAAKPKTKQNDAVDVPMDIVAIANSQIEIIDLVVDDDYNHGYNCTLALQSTPMTFDTWARGKFSAADRATMDAELMTALETVVRADVTAADITAISTEGWTW